MKSRTVISRVIPVAAITGSMLAGHFPAAGLAQESVQPPVYHGLWLPADFIPSPFQPSPYGAPNQSNPPRSNGSQSAAIYLPDPNGGDDQWIWVFIDGMSLHQSVEAARRWMAFVRTDTTMDYKPASMEDEALVPVSRIRAYLGKKDVRYVDIQGGLLIQENHRNERSSSRTPAVWRRNLLVDPIRIGRMTVGLRVEGHWVEQNFGGNWRTVRETPTSEQLVSVAQLFLQAIRNYARSQGWNPDGEGESGTQDPAVPIPGGLQPDPGLPGPGGIPIAGADPAGWNSAMPADSPFGGGRSGVPLAMVPFAVGGLAAIGAGLMMFGMGVTPRDVIDGVREIFGGSAEASETSAPPEADDDFDRWKRDYESRGWRYTEKDGVAEFEPVEGATNEGGWSFSEERGGFIPPEDQRPQPEAPPADATYREEVRLLQEDIERQRDLLDRERDRLRNYEQAGLDELVPGARERIRQYERLADLNQDELERLNEDRPTHTVEENRDLEADTGERLRSRDTIRELNESEEHSDAIQERFDTEAAREAATRQAEERVAENLPHLKERVQGIIDEKTREGYFVRNSSLPKKAWNNTLGRAVEWAGGWKGGQCGEFGQWGIDWSKDTVRELFGPDAIVTDITADSIPMISHRATKVILPDGQRLVLDYWESMPDGKPSISSEKEWVERWEKNLYTDYLGKGVVGHHGDQVLLKDQIRIHGEEAGIEQFRHLCRRKNNPEYAEIFIRSWKKDPW